MTFRNAAVVALLLLGTLFLGAEAVPGAGNGGGSDAEHLFVVSDKGAPASALARSTPRVIAEYESFTLVEASGDDADRLRRAGADERDDMRLVRLGGHDIDPVTDRPTLAKSGAPDGPGLAVVQFVGPTKDAWLARLDKIGVRTVIYMAQNAYLVHGSAAQLTELADLVGADPAVRAVVAYTADDKLAAGVRTAGTQRLQVQTLSGTDGAAARTDVDGAGDETRSTSSVGPFRNQFMRADAGQVSAIAADPGVIAVLPDVVPELNDEVQGQILAGNTTGTDPLLPSPPGYFAFHEALGLGTATFPFSVDITDDGVDDGTTATTHPDLHENGTLADPSRIAYASNYTTDANARGCDGHGTHNAGIVGGFNTGTGSAPAATAVEDANGYNYGLGIAPRVQVGNSKIFKCKPGGFSVSPSLAVLVANAYNNGARVSNNSWGAANGGAYNVDSQTYDKVVRDAVPGTAGNQQYVELFSAGNSGSAGNTIGSPGTAKNVITVGAAENVRAIGAADGCGVTDSGADDAHDIINFSSRGPTDDGRIKPDVVGPGTHITSTKTQTAPYSGMGVCNGTFPTGSTFYNLSSGTSHSTPALAGMAALVREWYRQKKGGGTEVPSPALTKAILAQSGTDLVGGNSGAGAGINTNVPDQVQGWGLANLSRALDTGPRIFVDQKRTLGTSGETSTRTVTVANTGQPVRITLAYTDTFGPTTGNSFVNDLNLVVTGTAGTFKGNVFSAGQSATGGTADTRNNLESVYLPAGTSGTLTIDVVAGNLAGDGVPGNADTTDQDFALTASNVTSTPTPEFAAETTTATAGGDADGVLEPGEPFTIAQEIHNVGDATATGVTGTLTAAAPVSIEDGTAAWPNIAADAIATNADQLRARLDAGAGCGVPATASLSVTSTEGATLTVPVVVQTGATGAPVAANSTDVPKTIPDNTPAGVDSAVVVAAGGRVKDVDVRIGSLTHTFDGDLRIALTSPGGTTVVLTDQVGGNGQNFTNTVFDDEAAAVIGNGNFAPFTGSFKPSGDSLARFDGEVQSGTWTLNVADLAGADTGTLNNWGHDISPAECSAPVPVPGAITNLTATGGAQQVSLQWDDTATATSYNVYRKNGGTYPATPTASPATSDLVDTGRADGTQYCYKVEAVNASGAGPLSAEMCATTDAAVVTPPGAIANLTATGGAQQVTLEWDDTATATSYNVYRKDGGTYPAVPTTSPAASTLVDTGRADATEYCYKLEAVNAGGAGPLSAEMCATTDAAAATPPGAIADLVAAPGNAKVSLTWSDTPTATSYKVFRRNPDGTYPAAATATPATSDFVDTGRTNGTQECYRVLAANGAGDGPQSAETCATPTSGGGGGGGGTGTAPGAITALTAAGGQTAVTVDWADVSGATDYYVFKDDGLRAFGAMPIATVTASQYTQTGLPANMPACYKVQAHNATGTGLLSDQICATPTAATGGGNEIPVLPKLDLSGIPARVKVSANRKFTLTFAGTAGLTGAITLRSTKKVATRRGGTKRKRKLGNRAIAAPPSGVIVVTLKLSRKNMKALKRTGKLKVTMTAGLGDLAATRKFTLTAP